MTDLSARLALPPICTSLTVAVMLLALPQTGRAQTIGYDPVGAGPGSGASMDGAGTMPNVSASRAERRAARGRAKGSKRIEITPYIEVDQILNVQFAPVDQVLTYTQLVAGVDASISGRYNALTASVRYEHRIGWGKASSGDAVSGLVRGYTTLAPGLTLEAGAMATQVFSNGDGSVIANGLGNDLGNTNIYSLYGGPALNRKVGDLDISGRYMLGYTKIDQNSSYRTDNLPSSADVFDKSISQSADFQAGFAPYTIAPVGLAVGGTYAQEDISNLDQRVRNLQVRAMTTIPVSPNVQLTGAIGYEDVTVSSRNALLDSAGNPVVGSGGRYVTDKSSPRVLAYDVSGLTWEVGVMWRPSPRTSANVHVGRRYGSISYGGTFAYAPNDRSSLNIAVYDTVSGFGGQLNRALENLPDEFEVVRDPVTGNLQTCVSSLDGGNCLSGVLGSVRSSIFRARGITASYAFRFGHLDAGLAAGYDRRNFFGAQGTVLAQSNGVVDENIWVTAYLSGRLGREAGWSASAYANWLSSTDSFTDGANGYGATAAYYRMLAQNLRATAAVSVDGLSRKGPSIDDIWTGSALVGMRYSF